MNSSNLTWILSHLIPYIPIILLAIVSTLTSNLLSILNIHAPLKTRILCHPLLPWLTAEIKEMMKRREAAQPKFHRTYSLDDYASFKELKNATQSAVRHLQSLYFHNAPTYPPDSKSKWEILQKLPLPELNNFGAFPDDLIFRSYQSHILVSSFANY